MSCRQLAARWPALANTSCAGIAQAVTPIANLLKALMRRDIDLRMLPLIWLLRDAVAGRRCRSPSFACATPRHHRVILPPHPGQAAKVISLVSASR